MYYIHLTGQKQGNPVICIEGRLEGAAKFELELNQVLQQVRDFPGFCIDLGIYIDLEKVDSVCDECFKVFERTQCCYPIRFKGYSLFLEMQLTDHQLLPRTYSNAK